MNRTGAPSHCWLLTLQYVCYIINHISTASLGGQVPFQVLYGVTPVTEVHYLLEVSWQMCHASITHWTVTRAPQRCPDDEARATNARTVEMRANPFGAHASPFGASSDCF